LPSQVASCFVEENRKAFGSKMDDVTDIEVSMSSKDELHLLTSEVQKKILCQVTLFAGERDVNRSISVMTTKGITKSNERKRSLNAKSEDLLSEILPRNIVDMMNERESEISFQVATGSVIFVNIVRVSAIACHLTLQHSMRILANFSVCLTRGSEGWNLSRHIYVCVRSFWV
jgi:hypothetical protein